MKFRSSSAVCVSLFIVVLYTTCVVVVWQLNSPRLMEEDWKLQLHRSLMAAVRAFLTPPSIQLATDYRRYKERKNFLGVHPGTSTHTPTPIHPTHPPIHPTHPPIHPTHPSIWEVKSSLELHFVYVKKILRGSCNVWGGSFPLPPN